MSTSSSTTRPGRLMLTGIAWLYMLLAIPVVVLFCLEVTFIPLTIITVGLFALLAIVPMVAGVATLHRRLAEVVLGEPVPSPYRPVPSGGHAGSAANLGSRSRRGGATWSGCSWR